MSDQPTVFLVDDDDAVRDSLSLLLQTAGIPIEAYASADEFLRSYAPGRPGCLVLDMNMPDMSGAELQAELNHRACQLPVIFLTAHGDIPMTVRAIKAGALDFLTKPVQGAVLLERIQAGFSIDAERRQRLAQDHARGARLNVCFSPRELEVLKLVIDGRSNKEIAKLLGISHRTVEIYRAKVMEKTGSANVIELTRFWDAHQVHVCSKQ
ncbi:response regulator transcription factor [Methylococcus sp. EFPC2]|uniref:response regulator transcription factor n=1 Tax=Methylococcus sp. EFPC2 TaxID=2812648 RepID=UPI0019678C07|nr:response regulator [Methylococcus sp. EFPC2]QSA98604.1 response regulator transcription factor [Methylococcus sp. EFPC2]